MKHRKLVSLLLAAAMALSLTACAGAPAAGSSTPAAPAAETAEEAAEPAAAVEKAFAGIPAQGALFALCGTAVILRPQVRFFTKGEQRAKARVGFPRGARKQHVGSFVQGLKQRVVVRRGRRFFT